MTSWGIARNQLATIRWSAYSGYEMCHCAIPILGTLLPGSNRPRWNAVEGILLAQEGIGFTIKDIRGAPVRSASP